VALARRRYRWHYQASYGPDAEYLAARAQEVVDYFCEEWPQYYGEPAVAGYALGLVEIEVTVYSRDRWWVSRRARRLLTALEQDTHIDVTQMTEVSEKLPPHTHRGKRYLKEQQHGRQD
jgi:hypothetical protein